MLGWAGVDWNSKLYNPWCNPDAAIKPHTNFDAKNSLQITLSPFHVRAKLSSTNDLGITPTPFMDKIRMVIFCRLPGKWPPRPKLWIPAIWSRMALTFLLYYNFKTLHKNNQKIFFKYSSGKRREFLLYTFWIWPHSLHVYPLEIALRELHFHFSGAE